jgi:hypothetical protein
MNEAWHKNLNYRAKCASGKETLEHRQRLLEILAFTYNQTYVYVAITYKILYIILTYNLLER